MRTGHALHNLMPTFLLIMATSKKASGFSTKEQVTMVRYLARLCVGVTFMAFSLAAVRADTLIAVAGPLSGPNISLGEQVQQGAQMAVADLNAKGGVRGQQIRLLVGDDACDSEQAVAVARKLISDGAVFIAGHVCSHASIPASKIYEEAGVPMISPASTNPQLTDEGGPNVFRVVGRDDQQGIVAGDFLAENWGNKRIAILHDNSTYGKGLADETRSRLHTRSVQEAIYSNYEPGASDYSQLVADMGSASIDVMYIGGYSSEAGLIVREAYNQGLDIRLVGGDSLVTEEYWLVAGPAGEGTMMTFGPDPRMNPEAVDVVRRFRAQNFEPEGYTLHTYGAVQAWAQAVEKAGTHDVAAVSTALHANQFDTVLGQIRFDQNGDITAPAYVWYRWTNGDYVPIE
jgi:branched-chain amino acid transport system substrate-binding protein